MRISNRRKKKRWSLLIDVDWKQFHEGDEAEVTHGKKVVLATSWVRMQCEEMNTGFPFC